MRIKVVSSSSSENNATADKGKEQVYVLELEDGCVYVGKSKNVKKRLHEHMQGTVKSRSAAFTRQHKPTGCLLKRLGDLKLGNVSGDGPERDETLQWMHKIGPQKVRGWKFVRKTSLKAIELKEIESNIREMLDLCRKCGKKGHFASKCKALKSKRKLKL
jgi:hypothetical protein